MMDVKVKPMSFEDFRRWFLAAFQDETIHPGQRIKVTQAEILNMLVLEAKALRKTP